MIDLVVALGSLPEADDGAVVHAAMVIVEAGVVQLPPANVAEAVADLRPH